MSCKGRAFQYKTRRTILCWHFTSSMSGSWVGEAIKFFEEDPRAVHTCCDGHALNLACFDTVKHCKVMWNTLDTSYEITNLTWGPLIVMQYCSSLGSRFMSEFLAYESFVQQGGQSGHRPRTAWSLTKVCSNCLFAGVTGCLKEVETTRGIQGALCFKSFE